MVVPRFPQGPFPAGNVDEKYVLTPPGTGLPEHWVQDPNTFDVATQGGSISTDGGSYYTQGGSLDTSNPPGVGGGIATGGGDISTEGGAIDTGGGNVMTGNTGQVITDRVVARSSNPIGLTIGTNVDHIGFFGHAVVAQPQVPAVGVVTIQDVVDALVALGLITQAP